MRQANSEILITKVNMSAVLPKELSLHLQIKIPRRKKVNVALKCVASAYSAFQVIQYTNVVSKSLKKRKEPKHQNGSASFRRTSMRQKIKLASGQHIFPKNRNNQKIKNSAKIPNGEKISFCSLIKTKVSQHKHNFKIKKVITEKAVSCQLSFHMMERLKICKNLQWKLYRDNLFCSYKVHNSINN